MPITNAALAQDISDLVAYWSTFNAEYAAWISGTVAGGPSSDGLYPLTDYLGVETLTPCPAKLSDNVTGYVATVAASETAAAASETAAGASETAAAASAVTATAQAALADADRIAAEAAESGAVDAKVTAIAQAALTAADAIATAADVVLTNADVVLTHADVVLTAADVVQTGIDAAAAAASAASIDYTWASITGTPTTIAGYGITDLTALINANTNVVNAITAYGWGDHSGLYSLLAHAHTFASLTSKPTTISGYGITNALALTGGGDVTYSTSAPSGGAAGDLWFEYTA